MVSPLVTSLLLSKSRILPVLMFYYLDYCRMSSLLIVLFHAYWTFSYPGTAYLREIGYSLISLELLHSFMPSPM